MTHHNFQVTDLPIQGKLVQQVTLLSIQAWLCWKHYLPIIISIHKRIICNFQCGRHFFFGVIPTYGVLPYAMIVIGPAAQVIGESLVVLMSVKAAPNVVSVTRNIELIVACIWFWPLEYYTCMTCYVSPLLKGICTILALKMLLAKEQICDVMLCLVWSLLIPVHMMSMLGWSSTPRCFRYWDSLTLGTALEAQYSDNISWELYSWVIQ